MKKTFFITAIALLTLGIISCHKEGDDNGGSNNSNNPTIGEWVDLGLPSGLLWYSVNLGATAPEHYGDYYAWGETSTKGTYNWSTYRFGKVDSDGELKTLTKYNITGRYGVVDNKTSLEAADDVATSVLGTGARIPTYEDWVELINHTRSKSTELNGVRGMKFTATNGNSLFMPVAGYRSGSSFTTDGTLGNYWSSSLYTVNPSSAQFFRFDFNDSRGMHNDCYRFYGYSVRAVHSSNQN